tara:strand:+ start:31 stop:1803 length:1773 start_codon:yes stop_codon:yes gene_type:complete
MAEDNLGEIMKNWDTMDIGELGTSLLARKANIEKSAAKRAKRDEKKMMAVGVLMAGQSLWSNAANRRIAEAKDGALFNKAKSQTQLPELKLMGEIYGSLDTLENSYGGGVSFVTPDGKIAQNDKGIPLWQIALDNNPQILKSMTSSINPQVQEYLINHGAKDLVDSSDYPEIQEQILTPMVDNFLRNRDSFRTGALDLLNMPEDTADTTLFSQISGISLSELDEVKLRRVQKQVRELQEAGSPLRRLATGVFNRLTGGENAPNTISVWKSLKDQDVLPIEQTLKDINVSFNITENIRSVLALPVAGAYEDKAKGDQALRESMLAKLESLKDLQKRGSLKTGISHKRRGARLLRRSHLYMLQDELNQKRNSSIKQDMLTASGTLYHRLIDKNDKTFNKAFFNGKYVEDEAYIENAALSYVIATSVKDVRTFSEGGTGRPKERTGVVFGDVNNFDYNFDTVHRMTKRMFKVEDGQFIAEQAFIDLKNPIEKADAYHEEFKHIMNKTNLTEDQKNILTERLIFDTDAADVYNVAFDFSPAWTNAQIIDKFSAGMTVQDILDNYSTQFTQPNWYEVGLKSRIRQADEAAKKDRS